LSLKVINTLFLIFEKFIGNQLEERENESEEKEDRKNKRRRRRTQR
jgi:hypothetical protein